MTSRLRRFWTFFLKIRGTYKLKSIKCSNMFVFLLKKLSLNFIWFLTTKFYIKNVYNSTLNSYMILCDQKCMLSEMLKSTFYFYHFFRRCFWSIMFCEDLMISLFVIVNLLISYITYTLGKNEKSYKFLQMIINIFRHFFYLHCV